MGDRWNKTPSRGEGPNVSYSRVGSQCFELQYSLTYTDILIVGFGQFTALFEFRLVSSIVTGVLGTFRPEFYLEG